MTEHVLPLVGDVGQIESLRGDEHNQAPHRVLLVEVVARLSGSSRGDGTTELIGDDIVLVATDEGVRHLGNSACHDGNVGGTDVVRTKHQRVEWGRSGWPLLERMSVVGDEASGSPSAGSAGDDLVNELDRFSVISSSDSTLHPSFENPSSVSSTVVPRNSASRRSSRANWI